MGTPEQAIETYAGLLVLNPTLALTPFWRDDEFRATALRCYRRSVIERVEEVTGPGAGAESLRTAIRVFTGRNVPSEQELRAALAFAPGDPALQVALGRLLTAGGRREEAEPLLRGAVQRKSDSPDAHAALGDWYAAGNDTPRARREWLVAAYLGDVRAMDALGQSYPAGAVPEAVIERQQRAGRERRHHPLLPAVPDLPLHIPAPRAGRRSSAPATGSTPYRMNTGPWQEHLAKWQEDRQR